MNIIVGQSILIDFIGSVERKEVVINRDYQRGAGLWPETVRSYFIDTILEGYQFPQIYLYQTAAEKTGRPYKELVDGQQRITSIIDFYNDRYRLNVGSKKYRGYTYSELPEEIQNRFISFVIPIATIMNATRPELLELFRRMNAYTAPLNPAEKRHSEYNGEFKWFVVNLADVVSPIFENYGIISSKQLARMADSEFISEMAIVMDEGIISKSSANIDKIYKRYDLTFDDGVRYEEIIKEFFLEFVGVQLSEFVGTNIMKPYVIHSLFCAFAHLKYGIPNGENALGFAAGHGLKTNYDEIRDALYILDDVHENQDEDGDYGEYVSACLSTTTKQAQRTVRARVIAEILAAE
ncbi:MULTISPECIES: DUF262 domain-containing protein [Aeromonas]|uniref:DUF262 domain-containing protein n=1 Tax=Aeromonas TaxID=642 RepID=UPI0020B26C7A|nr:MULTISPECIES: DUF262 domain-containing protein [Aeromonas]MCP3322977.1 DUF262 domain-containing protein [Aeromonas hydrophila]WAF99201.1 DUF262 domain-containing protein [Aeromonas dhakensis]